MLYAHVSWLNPRYRQKTVAKTNVDGVTLAETQVLLECGTDDEPQCHEKEADKGGGESVFITGLGCYQWV